MNTTATSATVQKDDLQLLRAAFHIAFHIIAISLVASREVSDEVIDQVLDIAWKAVVVAEIFMISGYRMSQKCDNWYTKAFAWFHKYIARYLIRPKEYGKPTAMTTYVLGLVVIRLGLAVPVIECLYIMAILSWGDPFARIGGIKIKGPYLPFRKKAKKTWAGFLTFFFVSTVVVVIQDVVLIDVGMLTLTTVPAIAQIVAVFAGAFAEAYAPFADNFFITLVAYGGYAVVMG
ncbi:MAG: hypothetical protein COU32_03055 [Candidatus Magasanikbacteria bacterium CG10_big_fil_rev_8_21_14_0_10_42_10]|uniref:Dolichol kinase n=2 Tax=Candidatus Magasanikiibacteriota TaxID=1752731 RepID=A0A2H0TVN8_9BACT|nr:MAG: hypothetical protein COU32_03055 [Candidatus Magasanikbacteria bacterium CG10_big_fil_rev_8_21_14_0_10_42_10]PIZ93224.1 MAG: hypothetical protein COX82_03215 [Candidatus Magasanikbacteria bacterium CG_4_10_14_0_2_um_filter_41_10]